MAVRLVTGIPGSGKTLYTVAEILRSYLREKLDHNGKEIPRRLVVGGIRDLVVEHEPMEVGRWDQPAMAGNGREVDLPWHDAPRRDPGDPPIEGVPREVMNWWLWAMPGDVIVVDECQTVFRPRPAGSKLPQFITRLEIHRHYGVDFVLITQHPQLLNASVRALVGPHQEVRRVWGGASTVVYEWDKCTNPDRLKSATARHWRYPRKAFKLYKSAELHTKPKATIPVAAYALLAGLVVVPILGYQVYQRIFNRQAPSNSAAALGAAAPAASRPASRPAPIPAPVTTWPALNVSPAVKEREPFHDRALHLAGCYQVGKVPACFFTLSLNGRTLTTVSQAAMGQAGYAVRWVAPCSVVVIFGELERPVTCDAPVPAAPRQAASGATI